MLFHQNCETLFSVFSATVTVSLRDQQHASQCTEIMLCIFNRNDCNSVIGSKHAVKIKYFISFFCLSADPVFYIIIYSHFFKISLSFFTSSGFAICPFIPAFFAICTSSAKAFAVMATIGSCPRSPDNPRIAAVAS